MMNLIYQYWGKANQTDSKQSYHLLAYHCLDVVAIATCWWQHSRALRKLFTRTLDLNEEEIEMWLKFFIALHDLGKFDARFQSKAREVALTLQPQLTKNVDPFCTKGFDHGRATEEWFFKETYFEDHEPFETWISAVAAHHGYKKNQPQKNIKACVVPDLIKQDAQARQLWVQALKELFPLPSHFPPPIPFSLLAGFCSVADWMGSHSEYFPYERQAGIPFHDYLMTRQHAAQQVLRAFGLYCPACSQGGMRSVFPDKIPRNVQTLVDDLAVEPGLTLIEAPTGSGKTEAALAYASKLLAAQWADSLILALPTQATSNAMLTRLEHIAEMLFSQQDESINLVLAHGKARFNQDFQQLQQVADRHSLQGQEEALLQCSHWLAESRKRIFLGQIGLCTIDQVLLSVLPLRHNFVRGFGLHKSILIIDEIHAYDWYMYGLLSEVLKAQAQAHGSVILLSATLPAHRKQALFSAWSATLPEETDAYPLITHMGTTFQHLTCPSPPERSVHFSLEKTKDLCPSQTLLQQIIAAAQAQAKVAILCNLVDDAQRIWQQLQILLDDLSIPIDLFHARFQFCDRQKIELAVLQQYGRDAPSQGRILVATQVVEQSLDLDFDWIITQLCPVDLLFQRLGRLHRHARPRPAQWSQPTCTVLLPEETDYLLHQVIYKSRWVLWRTQCLLAQHSSAVFPDAYRTWIEQVYQPTPWPGEPLELQQEWEDTEKQGEGKYYAAKQLSKEDIRFQDSEEMAAALTRDGEMNLSVIPVTKIGSEPAFLDGTLFKSLTPWQWEESLHVHSIATPHSWHQWIPSKPDPRNQEIRRYFLTLEPLDEETWQGSSKGIRFVYSTTLGLQKCS